MTVEMVTTSLSLVLLGVGACFFVAGTVGMLRFPEVFTRLHALTKADNLGFGFVSAAVVVVAPGLSEALKVLTTWGFVLVAATTSAHLVAQSALREQPEQSTGDGDAQRGR